MAVNGLAISGRLVDGETLTRHGRGRERGSA
jgi:hypothetical protein